MGQENLKFRWQKAIISEQGPESTTRLVLLALSIFMDKHGACFPSTAGIAKATKLSERCVCEHLGKAEQDGWIEKMLAGYNGKGWKRHKYLAVIPDKVGKDVAHDSDKALTEGQYDSHEGTDSDAEGTDSDDIKALTEGQSNKLVNRTKNTRKIFSQNSNEFRLSEMLYALLVNINPKLKKPNFQTWAKHIDRAIRLDKRSPEDLERVMRWALADSFWQSNIQSTSKLRKQFDQLYMKMRKESGTTIQNAGKSTAEPGKYDAVPEFVVDV